MSATTQLHPSGRRRGVPRAALAAAGCAVAIAACGSSGHKPGAAPHTSAFLAFSECMRSHGVTNFPDPAAQGGLNLDGTGINPFSPSFKAAQATCRKLLPGGGPPAHASEQQKEQLVATSQCIRSHGISGFPDPTTTAPTSLQNIHQNYSIVEGIAGSLFLLVPKTINIDSPAFKRAAKACHFQ